MAVAQLLALVELLLVRKPEVLFSIARRSSALHVQLILGLDDQLFIRVPFDVVLLDRLGAGGQLLLDFVLACGQVLLLHILLLQDKLHLIDVAQLLLTHQITRVLEAIVILVLALIRLQVLQLLRWLSLGLFLLLAEIQLVRRSVRATECLGRQPLLPRLLQLVFRVGLVLFNYVDFVIGISG